LHRNFTAPLILFHTVLTLRFEYAIRAIRVDDREESGIDFGLSNAKSNFPIFAGTIGESGWSREGQERGSMGKVRANVINASIGGPYKMEKLRTREKRFRFCTFLCDNCASSTALSGDGGISVGSIDDFARAITVL
jgi:hypothetical protein